MVDAVHIGGDDNPPQPAVDGRRQIDIGVVEQGRGVQDHLEQQNRDGRGSQGRDNRELDHHRDQDLDWMKAQAGRCIEFEVRMMHAVQAPGRRNGVKHHMLQVDRDVEQQH